MRAPKSFEAALRGAGLAVQKPNKYIPKNELQRRSPSSGLNGSLGILKG